MTFHFLVGSLCLFLVLSLPVFVSSWLCCFLVLSFLGSVSSWFCLFLVLSLPGFVTSRVVTPVVLLASCLLFIYVCVCVFHFVLVKQALSASIGLFVINTLILHTSSLPHTPLQCKTLPAFLPVTLDQ